MTAATDGLLTVQCLMLAMAHRGAARGFFALSGVAFASGGLRHLLAGELPGLIPIFSRISNVTNAVALTCLLLALPALWSPRWRRPAWGLAAVFVLAHLLSGHIVLPVLHTVIVFCGSLVQVAVKKSWQNHRWFGLGFALSLAAGAIFATRLTPAFFFNHNDLAHVVLLGAHAALHRQLMSSAR